MARLSGGEALAKQLAREGIRVVFGLPGVQLYGAIAGLRDEPSIRFITARHEQATTYMADGYARAGGGIGAALVVPGLVPYRPFWTALGVVAAELMVLVYASFSLRRRIGTRMWRRLHWLTYAVFGLATVHGLAAGTDTSRPWALPFYGAAVGAVLAAAGWRALVPPTQGGSRHGASRDRPNALHRVRPVRPDGAALAPSRR